MTTVVKQSFIAYFGRGPSDSKIWLHRYLCLFGTSHKHRPRLDIYPQQPSQPAEPQQGRISIYLGQIQEISQGVADKEQKFVFEIHSSERQEPFKFATNSQEDLEEWIKVIKSEIAGNKYPRTSQPNLTDMEDTKQFNRCSNNNNFTVDNTTQMTRFKVKPLGDSDSVNLANLQQDKEYELVVKPDVIQILDNNELVSNCCWPLEFIRRYGKNNNQFTIEAGRKCNSGEGVFSFIPLTCTSEDIFREVQARLKEKLGQDRHSKSRRSASTTDSISDAPDLPPRPYNAHKKSDQGDNQDKRGSGHSTRNYSNLQPPLPTLPKPRPPQRNVGTIQASSSEASQQVSHTTADNSLDSYSDTNLFPSPVRQLSSHSNAGSEDYYYSVPEERPPLEDHDSSYDTNAHPSEVENMPKLSAQLNALKEDGGDEGGGIYDHIDFRNSAAKKSDAVVIVEGDVYGEIKAVPPNNSGRSSQKRKK